MAQAERYQKGMCAWGFFVNLLSNVSADLASTIERRSEEELDAAGFFAEMAKISAKLSKMDVKNLIWRRPSKVQPLMWTVLLES